MLLINRPPFELVQLSTIPQNKWLGLPVFHPYCQIGKTPYWNRKNNSYENEKHKHYNEGSLYDVGVVFSWYPDPEFADLGVIRVRFIGDNGSTLCYSSDNLWTPKRFTQLTLKVTQSVRPEIIIEE